MYGSVTSAINNILDVIGVLYNGYGDFLVFRLLRLFSQFNGLILLPVKEEGRDPSNDCEYEIHQAAMLAIRF